MSRTRERSEMSRALDNIVTQMEAQQGQIKGILLKLRGRRL